MKGRKEETKEMGKEGKTAVRGETREWKKMKKKLLKEDNRVREEDRKMNEEKDSGASERKGRGKGY